MSDPINAFVEQFEVTGADTGLLHGRSLAVKDLFDIEGHVTGSGNPDWVATHGPAVRTAPSVTAMLNAGARIIGKTHTEELAFGLMGTNAHYGTPINTAAPDRVPGGSSSGSVAAVAAGVADIGLGTDTGGSVRLPASFCGVYGLRTTHGAIETQGITPLALSFDTVGWFSKNLSIMARVAEVYGLTVAPDRTVRLMMPSDVVALAEADAMQSLAPATQALQDRHGGIQPIQLCPDDFADWREVFRICQGAEAWDHHGAWIIQTNPSFGPGVVDRFKMSAAVTADERHQAEARRAEIKKHVAGLLGDDGVLVMPTAPGAAPLRVTPETSLNDYRMAALSLLCTAGLCGLPQLNVPVGNHNGAPFGLSLMGTAGSDRALLDLAGSVLPK